MAKKYLDYNGLQYFWQKIKSIIPNFTSDLTNDSGFVTTDDDIEWVDVDVLNDGGGGAMVVNVIIDEEAGTVTLDKTFDEIKNSAPNVVIALPDPDFGTQYLTMVTCGDVDSMFASYQPQWNGQGGFTNIMVASIIVNSDNTIESAVGEIEVS